MTTPDIEKLREELSAPAPISDGRKMTPRRIIRSLMPEILAQREKGVTLAQLVVWFSERGVKTTAGAISNYVSEYQKEASGETGKTNTVKVSRPSVGAQVHTPHQSGSVPKYKNL